MKKIFSLILTALVLMGMTSCLGNNDNNIATFTMSMFNRTVTNGSAGAPEFFVNNYNFTINYDNSTISLNGTATIGKDNTIQFTIKDMALSTDQSKNAVTFSCPKVTASGDDITNLKGYLSLQNGTVYITYSVGTDKTVYATGGLPFIYNKTEFIPDGDESKSYTLDNCKYDFNLNKSNMTATVTIVNFIPKANESDQNRIAVFEGLNLQVTSNGYKITSPEVKSTTTGRGDVSDVTLKDVEFNIIDQGIRFRGSYKTSTYDANVAGNMFDESKAS